MTLNKVWRIVFALVAMCALQAQAQVRQQMGPAPPPQQVDRRPPEIQQPSVQGPAAPPTPRIPSNNIQPYEVPQPSLAPRMATRQQVPMPGRPLAPFELSREQEAEMIRVLRAWEDRSTKVQTMACEFKRFDYDEVFGQRDQQNRVIPKVSEGEIKYAAPDKGLYHIVKIQQPGKAPSSEGGEHWVCDGQSIWEYNYEKQQLIERRLPPAMQGKAITDGPLPFLFGAQADKLLDRYWMRVVTPPTVKNQVWLEAFPKQQADAANFRTATVILDGVTLLPQAIEIHLPNGKSRHVHTFHDSVVNANVLQRFLQGDFAKPALPRGWTKVEDPPRAAAQPANVPRG